MTIKLNTKQAPKYMLGRRNTEYHVGAGRVSGKES